ncbi:hypothetical protein D3C79_649540 [compost metagenome]
MQALTSGQVELPLQPQRRQLLLYLHELLVIGAAGLLQLAELLLQLGEPLMAGQLLRLQAALLAQ